MILSRSSRKLLFLFFLLSFNSPIFLPKSFPISSIFLINFAYYSSIFFLLLSIFYWHSLISIRIWSLNIFIYFNSFSVSSMNYSYTLFNSRSIFCSINLYWDRRLYFDDLALDYNSNNCLFNSYFVVFIFLNWINTILHAFSSTSYFFP